MRALALVMALLLLAALWPLSCAQNASAWSNGGYSSDFEHPDYGTHDWIADQALALLNSSAYFLSKTYHSKFLLGTEAPDNPDLIGDTREHHVYYYSSGALQEDDGAIRASVMYKAALADLESSNYSEAAYHAGAMAHYIADVGAYGHTMGNSTDWGTEQHHTDYEDAVNTFILTYEPDLRHPSYPTEPYNSTLRLARNVTFGQGPLRSNIWMDSNYNWDSTEFLSGVQASLDLAIVSVASSLDALLDDSDFEPSDPSTQPQEDERAVIYLIGLAVAGFVSAAILAARRRAKH